MRPSKFLRKGAYFQISVRNRTVILQWSNAFILDICCSPSSVLNVELRKKKRMIVENGVGDGQFGETYVPMRR